LTEESRSTYLSNGGLDVDYLLEEDLGEEEFIEAEEKLIDRAYRDVTEWRMAVRSEQEVKEVNSLAEDAARTAYIIDRVQTEYLNENSIGNLSDDERETVTQGNRAWRFVNDSGTQMQYEGREPEDIEGGAFVLVNGNNASFESTDLEEEMELYRAPASYISEMSGPFEIRYIDVDEDADLEDLPGDGERIEF
jgi:hypothetical protein